MIDLGPPPLILPAPAIIHPIAEPWERKLSAWLTGKGVPLAARLSVLAEMRRVLDAPPLHREPMIADLLRHGPLLGLGVTPMVMLAGYGGAATFSATFSAAYVAASAQYSSVSSGTHTFTSVPWGAVASGPDVRYTLVVVCWAGNGSSVASGTINGVAATLAYGPAPTQFGTVGFLIVANPTGTSGSVVVNLSSSDSGRMDIFVYRLLNPSGLSPKVTPASNRITGSSSASVSQTRATDDVTIAGASVWYGFAGNLTWTTATEDAEQQENSGGNRGGCASYSVAGSTAISVNGGSCNELFLAAVTYGA